VGDAEECSPKEQKQETEPEREAHRDGYIIYPSRDRMHPAAKYGRESEHKEYGHENEYGRYDRGDIYRLRHGVFPPRSGCSALERWHIFTLAYTRCDTFRYRNLASIALYINTGRQGMSRDCWIGAEYFEGVKPEECQIAIKQTNSADECGYRPCYGVFMRMQTMLRSHNTIDDEQNEGKKARGAKIAAESIEI
jgi:hypothetical protein